MADGVPATPPGPIDMGTSPAPAGTRTTLSPDCAKTPCTLCFIRAKVREAKETAGATFGTEPLRVNTVGFRLEDSISDEFDDLMVVFFRALTPDQREQFEKVVEPPLRDDLKALKHARTRLVTCTDKEFQGVWVVGIYDAVTTDPGLEGRKADYDKKKSDAEAAVQENKDRTLEVEKAIAERKALIDQKSAEKLALDKKKKEMTPDDVAASKKLAIDVGKLGKDQKKDETELKALRQKLPKLEKNGADARAAYDAIDDEVLLAQGKEGWLAQGRAVVAPGAYPGGFRFYLHHASKTESRAHVAMTTTDYLYRGFRVYTVGDIKAEWAGWIAQKEKDEAAYKERADRAEKNKKPPPIWVGENSWTAGGLEVGRHIPAGGAVKKLEDGKASFVLKPSADGKSSEALLVVDGAETPLPDGDAVAIRARIGGTNLHRAHNTALAADKKKLESGDKIEGARVGNWSEGCQTHRSFDHFNEFIRIHAVSKRWRCKAGADAAKLADPGCAVLVASPDGEDALGSGEKALLAKFGEGWVRRSLRTLNKKDLAKAEEALKKLTAERDKLEAEQDTRRAEREKFAVDRDNPAWDDEKEKRRKAASGKEKEALDQAKQHAWSPEKEKQLAAKDAEIVTKQTELEKAKQAVIAKERERDLYAGVESDLGENQKKEDALVAENDGTAKTKGLKQQLAGLEAQIKALEKKRDAPPPPEPAYPPNPHPKRPLSPEEKEATDKKHAAALEARHAGIEANRKAQNDAIAPLKRDYDEKKAKLDANTAAIEELQKLASIQKETQARRREFIRERARSYAADYLRECDLGGCAITSDYVLVEVPRAVIDDLKDTKLDDARNAPWSGDPVLGKPK